MICCFTSQMKGYWIFGGIRSNGYSTLFCSRLWFLDSMQEP